MKKITERLQLLSDDGQKHYLEYLRNFTPQILLWSLVWIISHNLHSNINLVGVFLFILLFSASALATWANSILFYKKCFSELSEWSTSIQKTSAYSEKNTVEKISFKLQQAKKDKLFLEFFEVIVVIFFMQASLAVIIYLSIGSATSMIKMFS